MKSISSINSFSLFTVVATAVLLFYFTSNKSQEPIARFASSGDLPSEVQNSQVVPQLIDHNTDIHKGNDSTPKNNSIKQYLQYYTEQYPLPESLNGVAIDGEIAFNDQGELQKSLRLRQLFVQLLTLENEWDEQTVRIWLTGYAQTATQLMADPDNATEQVLTSFDNYLAYLNAADSHIPKQGYTEDDFLAKFKHTSSSMHELRNQYFGDDTAENYFKDEELYDQSQYDRAVIRSDETLTDAERMEKMAIWRENIEDPKQRKLVQEQFKSKTLSANIEAMQENGASDEDIYLVRKNAYGDAAALRLAALDQSESEWQRRFLEYKQRYQSLLGQQLSAENIKQSLQPYVSENFSLPEQRRLATLMRLQ